MTKFEKWGRVPTRADLDAFSGVHCAAKWKRARDTNWRCPSCGRNADEIVRWSFINGATMRALYADEHGMGWTTSIVMHHSHDNGRRFQPAVLCGDCNSADGTVKRKLKLPASWSFSPSEIGEFVVVAPYSGRTAIDFDFARLLYKEMAGQQL